MIFIHTPSPSCQDPASALLPHPRPREECPGRGVQGHKGFYGQAGEGVRRPLAEGGDG